MPASASLVQIAVLASLRRAKFVCARQPASVRVQHVVDAHVGHMSGGGNNDACKTCAMCAKCDVRLQLCVHRNTYTHTQTHTVDSIDTCVRTSQTTTALIVQRHKHTSTYIHTHSRRTNERRVAYSLGWSLGREQSQRRDRAAIDRNANAWHTLAHRHMYTQHEQNHTSCLGR